MPLASKDGKLYVKTEIDENGNEVKKLCTSCCGGTPATGCCCRLKEDGSTDKVITTTSEECSAYISPQTDVVAVKFNPGKNCDDPSVDCSCFEYEEYSATEAEAKESFAENYGAFNWSLFGGYIYDPNTDQWSYRAICCDELSYDDQGNEWCGTPQRSNPLP